MSMGPERLRSALVSHAGWQPLLDLPGLYGAAHIPLQVPQVSAAASARRSCCPLPLPTRHHLAAPHSPDPLTDSCPCTAALQDCAPQVPGAVAAAVGGHEVRRCLPLLLLLLLLSGVLLLDQPAS